MAIFRRLRLFELPLQLRKKTRKQRKFFSLWKLWLFFVKLSKSLPKYVRKMILRVKLQWNLKNFIFLNYYSTRPWSFHPKKTSVHIKLLWNSAPAGSILAHRNIIPFIYWPLKLGCLNFRSFPSFRIGSLFQNDNPETREGFNVRDVHCFLLKKFLSR